MLTSFVASAVLGPVLLSQAGGSGSVAMREVTAMVTYRERMALPADAELVVSLDRFGRDGQVSLSESRILLAGRQVPVSLRVTYSAGSLEQGARYGLRAEILSGGRRLFESASHAMVISNNRNRVEMTLVRSQAVNETWKGVDWTLLGVEGKEMAVRGRAPSLRFEPEGGRMGGHTGVNTFGGSYVWEGGRVQIDPGAMTMMAGSPEAMQIEQEFLRLLPLANRLALFEGELVLSRGEKELLRFRRM